MAILSIINFKKIFFCIFLLFCAGKGITQTCNNWLATPSIGSTVSIGDLDIIGNKVTVEALIKRTQPYLPGGGNNSEGDVVTKHNTFTDVNYVLRPNHGYVTTTNGFFATPDVCEIQLNKTYHIAMVYDGSTLKYYRDGFLLSQIAASGNLILNNWKTRFGWYEPQGVTSQFIGYMNEVRIWNVARTQAQIQSFMTSSLPNPTTQIGLQGYYTFDNLLNKQGDATFNGVLGGAAAINQTNTDCGLVRDSCNVPISNDTSVIVNTYTPVIDFDKCANKVVVEDASTFNPGDTVLIIQMKGAVIDSSNTNTFGTVTDYKNAGNYEFNIVKTKAGNTVELKNNFLRQYDVPLGRVQLIRVPYFQNYVVTDTLTCLPWDGRKGGVLVLNVKDTIELEADINTTGKGFLKGTMRNSNLNSYICGITNYYYPDNTKDAAGKGEGITDISTNRNSGKGSAANGGGGGMNTNSGGGGGSNGNIGGRGGYELNICPNYQTSENWGLPGKPLDYNNLINKIFMGGAGGAGHSNNQFYNPAENADFNGGNGGGIIIINSDHIKNNNHKIISKGDSAYELNIPNSFVSHDGMGGGGAGGTILLHNNSFTNPLLIDASGGRGGNMVSMPSGGLIGPGGGGGGGTIWLKQSTLPASLNIINAGGTSGVIIQNSNDPYGATGGLAGINVFSLSIPVTTIPFKPAIDSVRIRAVPVSCNTFNFSGLGFINIGSIQSWQWSFGDNTTSSSQNITHTYSTTGSYTVKLVATDNNGCKDSITANVNTTGTSIDFAYSQNTCSPLSVQFFNLTDPAPLNPQWIFGDGNTNTGSFNPVNVYADTGSYTVKYIAQNGSCIDTVTKVIAVKIFNDNIIETNDTTICFGTTKKLFTKPSLGFCWSPTTNLDDPLSPSPTTNTTTAITYYFTAEIQGANIITNGDFNEGNTGFSSGYQYSPATGVPEGVYNVGANIILWHSGMNPCSDHTTGSGNMLMVNGDTIPDVIVWTQTVSVQLNTNYSFSTWLQHITSVNAAKLQFSINGVHIGNIFQANSTSCIWDRFYTTWNSGNNNTAVISIINKNVLGFGNDFALDDISFSPVTIRRDSVRIAIDTPAVNATNDTLVCERNPVQLIATGAVSYSWLPAAGLSNAAISNPVAVATDTVQYIVRGTSASGCTATDTVNIFTKPSPVITSLPDTGFCRGGSLQLSAAGGNTYSWLPAAGLNNAGISNPVTTSDTTITYIVSGTGNGCTGFDTVKITVSPLPVVKTIADTAICIGNSLPLSATGAASYSWQPAIGLSNANISNPLSTPADTTQYIVTGTTNFGCAAKDTVNVFTRVLPVVTAGNDVITCVSTSVQLSANGANTYTWAPATGLSNAGISNPTASPADTTQYTVRGTDVFGCGNTDSVMVFTRPLPVITLTGDTTVCKNQPLQLSATGGVSYQWLPATGLSNAGIANPVASISSSTVYRVTVTSSNNCTETDSVTLTTNAGPVFTISPNDSSCGDKQVRLNASGGSQYLWAPASLVSDANIANPLAIADATTVYTVIITENTCNISDTLATTIKILALPPVSVSKSNDIDCSTLNAQLTATGADQYTWTPAQSLSSSSSATPIANPAATVLYTVTGTNLSTKCNATDTITVFVNKAISNNLFIPSAFTPNDDELNKCWRPVYTGAYTDYALTIYNRYGEPVFSTDNINTCWDGTYKGKKQDPGNFVYILKIKNLCRGEFKKGNLLLIR